MAQPRRAEQRLQSRDTGALRGRRAAVVVGGLGLFYGLYETGMRLRWLCRGECNIRVDLLLLYPLLLAATVAAAVSLLRENPA